MTSNSWSTVLFSDKAVLISVQHLLLLQQRQIVIGEVMQVGGLWSTCALLYMCLCIQPHLMALRRLATSSTQPCLAAEWWDRPVLPSGKEQRVRGWVVIHQCFSSSFCLSAPLSWFTCEESRSTSVQDVASLSYSCLISLLLHLHSHIIIILFQLAELQPLLRFSIIYPSTLDVCFFSLYPSTISLFPCFCLSLPLPSILLVPFPRFSPMPHLGAEPIEQHLHTEPGPNLPPSLSLPVYASSVPGAATEAGPYRPPSSVHLLYLSAGTLPSTHTVPLHLPREPGRRDKKDNTGWESIEKDYSCWGQACLTSIENTHCYPGRCTYTVPLIQPTGRPAQAHQQVSLKATDSAVGHQSISSFSSPERIWGSWETLFLKWYLCATAFFTLLSWLELHNFFFKTARTRAWIQCHHPDHVSQTCELPRLPLFDQRVCHTLLVYSNCQVHNKSAQSVCDHIFRWRKDQTEIRVIPTCWISWDHVSISQPLLTAHLRSSGKDKAEGNEVIQRGAHWKEDIIIGKKTRRILISFSPALPELAQHTNKNIIFSQYSQRGISSFRFHMYDEVTGVSSIRAGSQNKLWRLVRGLTRQENKPYLWYTKLQWSFFKTLWSTG